MGIEEWKRAAAEAAAKLVRDGMVVGLGSGTTVAQVVRALARLKPKATFVPSSSATQRLASKLGLRLSSLDSHERLDLMLDGADEVDPNFNLIKGRGGAHTREKMVASAARRVVIIVDITKLGRRLGKCMPVPVEVLSFAREYTMRKLAKLGGAATGRLSDAAQILDRLVLSPDFPEFLTLVAYPYLDPRYKGDSNERGNQKAGRRPQAEVGH